jgi:Mg2+ and Co2+ transporter CorA
MNNKLVFKKNEEKVHKIIKIYSENHKHKNSNVLNSLEKLKKKTKNVLNAYLSYINKDK